MIEWIVFPIAFGASLLTLFSGFGLGTLLFPGFALFFPLEAAVAMTGIVHFLNNFFKLFVLWKFKNNNVLLRFGLPAILAALAGAGMLLYLSDLKPLITYYFGQKLCTITSLKLILAFLMILFSLFEVIPRLKNLSFDKKFLPLGGLLSGFFGGLSGHQGAFRSVFLIRAQLSKESFIATGVVIACLVDFTRLAVYVQGIQKIDWQKNNGILIGAILAAFLGTLVGQKLLKKVTIGFVQNIVAMLLVFIATLLAFGII